MKLSARAKILIGVGLVAAGIVWLVLLDYGINAGRIHYGVHVRGVDVGGMTVVEAQELLRERGKELRKEFVVLSAEGIECDFKPGQLGWNPEAKETARRARSVGFRGSLGTSLRERLEAWFTGVEVDWAGAPQPEKLVALIEDCQAQAAALHLEVDETGLERLVARAITTWPRRIFQVPVSPAP